MENNSFEIERVYNAPIDKVWEALTNPDHMRKWYFDLPGFKAEEGYAFSFYGGDDQRQYHHLCSVTKVVPGKKLAYTWQYEGIENLSEVTFELFQENNNTPRIKLTHTGVDGFAVAIPNDPNFARSSFAAGWTSIIGTNLKDFVEQN